MSVRIRALRRTGRDPRTAPPRRECEDSFPPPNNDNSPHDDAGCCVSGGRRSRPPYFFVRCTVSVTVLLPRFTCTATSSPGL